MQEGKKCHRKINILCVAILLTMVIGLFQFGSDGICVFILYAILVVGYLLLSRKRRR